MRLALCLPTRGRPDLAGKAVRSALATATDPLPDLYVRLDEDDDCIPAYRSALEGVPHRLIVGPRHRHGHVDHMNDTVRHALADDADLLMQLEDDMVFLTKGWNAKYLELAASAPPLAMLCTLPWERGGNKFIRPPTLTRTWVEKTGAFCPFHYRHYFADTEINEIAEGAGLKFYVPDVQVEHNHQRDNLDARTECWREDAMVYAARYDIRRKAVAALRKAVQQ